MRGFDSRSRRLVSRATGRKGRMAKETHYWAIEAGIADTVWG